MRANPTLQDILSLVEALKTIQLAKGHRDHVKSRLERAITDESRLALLLNEKYESIESLASDSLRNLFISILKDREAQLEMERQEYLQVVLQYNQAKRHVELLQFELDILDQQIKKEKELQTTFEAAIIKHKDEIMVAFPDVGAQIIGIEEEISNTTANIKELSEAKEVAYSLEASLGSIIDNLDRASDWGNWNDLAFSQKIEVKAKNLFVDKALAEVYKAQLLFEKFEKELADIHDHQNIRGSYHFHDFGNFTEVYYNRLIADWVIQESIKNSKENVEGVASNVQLILASLKHEIHKGSQEILLKNMAIELTIKRSLYDN